MKRYCVGIIIPEINPLHNEVWHNFTWHHFDTKEQAERFKKESRRSGKKTTDVMDIENLPF